MTNSLCFIDNYPEAVSTVNVTENTIEFDGSLANFYEETFTTADLTDDTTFSLAHYPVSSGTIALYLNSGQQIQGTDYTVHGHIITMAKAVTDSADKIVVRYFAYASDITTDEVPVGTVLWQASSTAPTGYVLADGTTDYLIATYAALYAYCVANSLNEAGTLATQFQIKNLGMTVNTVTLYAIIKT